MSTRTDVSLEIASVDLPKIDAPAKASAYFGCNIFTNAEMNKRISKKAADAYKKWVEAGVTISMPVADEIAEAMKKWAIEAGAVYYTHWFQPMTGLTAEKHDAFMHPKGDGKVIEKFKGSNLIQGEPDASSFPSGGMRATFEARGYTAWDPSSPAFIIESKLGKTLCIPSIFVSYYGEALDKKLPLLRSEDAINKAALRLLKLFGAKGVTKVISTCGPEQEYFLVDKYYANMRYDLMLTNRTLTGAASPKGQQLEDQYFGSIKERVIDFMCEVTEEAYKLGIPVKTRHNEVAPHQYEFAPMFEESNLAADHNQLLMDVMKKVALRHDLVCLLHEKPFAGINGSGKHLNWSLADDKGSNLLDPGKTPHENLQFLAVLAAVLYAVQEHADLLRASVASAGNEHRLGANEAPPAIISVFLGHQLSEILDTIEKGKALKAGKQDIMDLGVARLPKFMRDNTDRNRTSPFAFTGNKFEFRALGSSQNISSSIMVVNTIVAEAFDMICDRIEKEAKGKGAAGFNAAVLKVVRAIIKETKAIRFEGDNYSDDWVKEAKKRGLANIPSTPEALKALIVKKNIALFEKYGVLTGRELTSRYNIWVELYVKLLDIEANTLAEMVDATIIPAAVKYQTVLLDNLAKLSAVKGLTCSKKSLADLKAHVSDITDKIYYLRKNTAEMTAFMAKSHSMDEEKLAAAFFSKLKPMLEHIRKHADDLETVVADDMWALPKYREMLFVM